MAAFHRVHLCRLAVFLWLSSAFVACSLPFVCFTALLLLRCLQIWLYLAFLGGFRGFYGVCVGLCRLGALRGLWGFCARVELGGLKACGVFASVFLSFPLYLPYVFPLFVLWLSCFTLVVFCCSLSWFIFVVSFSLTDYTQKERAQRFCSLRPLFVCCRLLV